MQIANSSITSGSGQILQSIGGPANYQVLARDAEGFPESVVSQIGALPGVRRTAAVFDLGGSAQEPNDRVKPVQLASGSAMLWLIDGLGKRLLLSRECSFIDARKRVLRGNSLRCSFDIPVHASEVAVGPGLTNRPARSRP